MCSNCSPDTIILPPNLNFSRVARTHTALKCHKVKFRSTHHKMYSSKVIVPQMCTCSLFLSTTAEVSVGHRWSPHSRTLLLMLLLCSSDAATQWTFSASGNGPVFKKKYSWVSVTWLTSKDTMFFVLKCKCFGDRSVLKTLIHEEDFSLRMRCSSVITHMTGMTLFCYNHWKNEEFFWLWQNTIL